MEGGGVEGDGVEGVGWRGMGCEWVQGQYDNDSLGVPEYTKNFTVIEFTAICQYIYIRHTYCMWIKKLIVFRPRTHIFSTILVVLCLYAFLWREFLVLNIS